MRRILDDAKPMFFFSMKRKDNLPSCSMTPCFIHTSSTGRSMDSPTLNALGKIDGSIIVGGKREEQFNLDKLFNNP
jgi:hypothetical protein